MKRSEPTSRAPFSSTSVQDSIFEFPIKSWLDLISSSKFVKSHLNIFGNNKEYTRHRFMLGGFIRLNILRIAPLVLYFTTILLGQLT
ncbi:hypothetical protein P3S68_023656 [Capsicum galapagoense]